MPNFAQYIVDRLVLWLWPPDTTRQIAALPYKVIDGRIMFLLVTSRRSGRWIVPKGSIVPGETPRRSAEIEAMEEAGVEGVIDPKPIGHFRTVKITGKSRHAVEVDLFPLRVTQQHDTWLEQDSRQRQWVRLKEAQRLLSDADLEDLLSAVSSREMARLS